jgi:hypothetical protein
MNLYLRKLALLERGSRKKYCLQIRERGLLVAVKQQDTQVDCGQGQLLNSDE